MSVNVITFLIILGFSLEFLIAISILRYLKFAVLIAVFSLVLIVIYSLVLLVTDFNVYSVLLFVVSVFRIINLYRVFESRLNSYELRARFSKTSIVLGFFTFVFLMANVYEISVSVFLIANVSLLISIAVLVNALISILKWRSRSLVISEAIKDLPTVSVCVPARNETEDLPGCIESILNSGYPKLEVLVLDDCSHDKTPQIIKSYAHQGVRFINGAEPSKGWVAKNFAMNKLYDEAKGEIVIFAGVDVRFSTETVQRIVEQLKNGKDMISVLPLRNAASEKSLFIQPLRYWWELAVPRFFYARPPVLSSCWAINSKVLRRIGEFDSVKKSVQPETHFAKRLGTKYSLVLSGNRFGLSSIKKPKEQLDTALRTRYPQLKRSPENVFMLLAVEFLTFGLPYIFIVTGYIYSDKLLILVSGLSVVFMAVLNDIITKLVVKKTWSLAAFTVPALLFLEWLVLIKSMLSYEFGRMIWKERNVCLPMLSAEKELPKLE